MSTFGMFEIGKSALIASKRTMDITSHNIANAATPGYSRQDALLEPLIQRQSVVSGVGVRVADIRRSRDLFIDAVLRNESGREASFVVQQEVLDHLQTAVAEPSGNSVRGAIDTFWSAWQDLSTDPSSPSARAQLVERGHSLVDMFRHLSGQIDSLTSDINNNIDAVIVRVNDLSERIVGYNVEIARAIARQEPASDLMDRRDLLIDEITELTGGTVTYLGEANAVKVSVGGFPIVDREKAYKMEADVALTGETEFRWYSSSNEYQVMPQVGGRLGGLKTSKDELVFGFREELETLFASIVDDINVIHSSGYTLSGAAGGDFFVHGSDYLGSVEINPSIVADPANVCAGRFPPPPEPQVADPYDGTNALLIADRISGSDDPLNPSFLETWTSMMGTLGAKAQKVETGVTTQGLLVKEMRNRKDSVSGVSVDEEMTNLIREQHAFNAASRVITVADEVIDTIINRMGHAGR